MNHAAFDLGAKALGSNKVWDEVWDEEERERAEDEGRGALKNGTERGREVGAREWRVEEAGWLA